MSEAFVYLTRA